MVESPLFKRAFVRGLNTELTRAGLAQYPSKEAADYAADFVADNSNMPDPQSEPDKITKEASLQLCNSLIEASGTLVKQAGGYLPEVTKTAQETTPASAAMQDCWGVMEKCAAETGSLITGGNAPNDMPAAASSNAEAALEAKRRPENYANLGESGVGNYERKGEGSVGHEEPHPEKPAATGEGGNSVTENTQKHSSLRKLANPMMMGGAPGMAPGMAPGGAPEEMPPAMAGGGAAGGGAAGGGAAPTLTPEQMELVALGVQLAQQGPEAVAAVLGPEAAAGAAAAAPAEGHSDAAAPPHAEPDGDEGPKAKEASLASIVSKIANTGSLITGGNTPNDLPAAAQNNAEAALELNRRPENYANKGEAGVGRSDMVPTSEQNVGREQPHPESPMATDSGKTNVPLEHIKSAFDQLFEATGKDVVPYLPANMDDKVKVAHVRAMMGLDTEDRGRYLENLYSQLGQSKVAAAGVRDHFIKSASGSEKKKVEEPKPAAPVKTASIQSLSSLRQALDRLAS